MKTITATVVVSTLLVLALGPTQLQGVPGHLRTHDGSTAENQEMERALIETLLSIAQHKDTAARVQRPPWEQQVVGDRDTAARVQYPPVEQQQFVGATDEQKSQVDKTALTQQTSSQYYVWARNQRIQNRMQGKSTEKAIAQQSGVTIQYCGAVGDIIQNALRFGLSFIPGGDSAYGVYIACAEQPTYPCTTVTVAVPANSIKADIDVCDYGKLY